ncbi:MAG: TetR/AcrR family transcriptional regulator [Spirochaetales bacterium]|nr:TetR/AcrR family transcriptional regulator [Spirochaetales bacterium]
MKSEKEKTLKNRQRIVNTATKLIMEKGAKETSLSDIAREVGISKGTLYYYYPTKSELIFDITNRHMRQITTDMLSWLENIQEKVSPDRLLTAVYTTLSKAEKRGKLHLYLIQEAFTDSPNLLSRMRHQYTEWKELLKRGLEKIVPDNPQKAILAELILASLDGIIIQSILGIKAIPIDKMTKYLLEKPVFPA